MSLVKDTAIVLRRLDYSESSQVLALLTRGHGQQRIIAKGVKRSTKTRVAVGLDLLEMGRVVFSARPGKESNLATLTEWRQEETFAHLRRDLAASYAGQYAAEVTSHLTEVHDPHPGMFDALRDLLVSLKDELPASALAAYLWRMLSEIGLRPELARCVSCQRDAADERMVYFSSREGGLICRDCEGAIVEKRRVSVDTFRWLLGDPESPPGDPRGAFDLLDYHITEIMARPPKLAGPLRDLLKKTARAKRA